MAKGTQGHNAPQHNPTQRNPPVSDVHSQLLQLQFNSIRLFVKDEMQRGGCCGGVTPSEECLFYKGQRDTQTNGFQYLQLHSENQNPSKNDSRGSRSVMRAHDRCDIVWRNSPCDDQAPIDRSMRTGNEACHTGDKKSLASLPTRS